MDYYQKYQKYRFKYLNLLNQSGGNKKSINDITKLLYDPTNHEYDNTKDVINIFEEFIKKDGLLLQHLDSNFRTNRMYKLAVKQNGCAIKYINSLIFDYVNICKLAVQQSGFALEHVKTDTVIPFDYFNICKLAVEKDGCALEHVKTDKMESLYYFTVCEKAVNKNGLALEFVNKEKMNDTEYKNICDLAVKQNPDAIKYIK